MVEQRSDEVIGSLPHSRPHRRSSKRPARPPGTAPAQQSRIPEARPEPQSSLPPGLETVGTVVEAVGELAEIAVGAGVRAIRRAVSNLPRP